MTQQQEYIITEEQVEYIEPEFPITAMRIRSRPHPAPSQQRIDLPMHHVRLLQSVRYVILKSHKTYPEYIAGTSNNRRDSIKFMQWLQKENPTAKVRAIGLDEYILESGALLQAGRK